KFSANAICCSSVMSWRWNTSTAYLSMPASISTASSFVSGLRRSTPETSPTKCLCSCRIAIAMAFSPVRGRVDPLRFAEGYSRAGACQRSARRRGSGIPRHQPAIDRDHCAGQERRRGQAEAERHVRDLLGIAVAAECGAALGVDRLVLLGDAIGDGGADRARADAVHGDAFAAELDRKR